MKNRALGSFWSVPQALASLNELAYFERAIAHVLAGWIPKVSQMDVKAELGIHLYQAIDRANQLRRCLAGLTRVDACDLPARQGWRAVMMGVDAAPDTPALLTGAYRVITSRLIELYQAHLAHSDPIGDAGSLRCIAQILPEVEAQLKWGLETLRRLGSPEGARSHVQDVESRWLLRGAGPELPHTESLWRPLDRVPSAARPAGLASCEAGSLGLLPVDVLRDARDIAIFLHVDLDEEYATLELIARNSYEHPDMPWQFHLDMARHASDEARHALLINRLLEARGFRYGDFPITRSSYDGLYQFAPCGAGSRKELLWRMLIRQTFMEGLALDSFAPEVQRRESAGQHDIANAFDYLLRDEVFHAASGLHWSRYLLGDDPRAMVQERYEALTYFTATAEAERARFVQDNLDQAMGELVVIEEAKRRRGGKLKERPLNRTARRQAGYTELDIQQVLDWGYADREG
jgi:uncharacterized ferritin-like protein (DUF455 family)